VAELLNNYIYLAAPVLAWVLSQGFKVLYYLVVERQLNIARLFDSGGMPSSHSAGVTALATAVGYRDGVATALFALSAIFAAVVVYDAMNLRKSAGDHAHVLNRIIPDLLRGKMVRDFDFKVLREMLGHSQLEAFIGCTIGFFVAYSLVVRFA